jgi:hypothetical protein
LKERSAIIALAIYATKPLAIGAATFMQGYSARLGFGIIRISIHTREAKPKRGRKSRANSLVLYFM